MDSGALIEEKYQVIEHIGRGGMADVWSARDQRLRRMVAIKTIAAGLTQDMDPLALFEKEAQTIAGMEHPHILPIYSFGSYEGSLYIAMRYVTGGSLEDTLENGAMNTQEVLRIGKAVGQALDHAHQNNIIHLDLKPGNILLDSNDAPYLADFGLATVLDPEGRAKNPGSGTLLYMAPEQLVSDMIDYRADIYSFCIMLYHMFTGQLPFEGTVPLAMKQLQNGQNLPEVSDINPDLHDGLTEILRLGTAQDATLRPDTHADVMDQLQDLFTPITVAGMIDPGMSPTDTGMDMIEISVEQERLAEFEDADLLEAVDIYTRARRAWAGGHGRFVPGLTHFMIVSDYYMQADYYHLSIDDSGYQLLLRGALEYNYELDYWWGQLHNQDAQRRVCLHTLRSGTAPARIRALKRLEYLPDDETSPVIPRLISQALEVEGDDSARIAALNTLRIRAKSIQRYQFENTPKVKPDENTMLDSVASQMGIQLAPPSEWQEVVYSDEVDELIAETALDDDGSDQVTEFAARTVGQIHSLAGVRHIANAAREKRRGALEALALVRDETTSLPDEVDRQARLYAWLMNTLRRMIDRPLDGILRFVLVLLGAWVGMGEVIYVTFNSSTLFSPQRWMYTIAVGIVFGLFVALTLMVTDELSRRLSGFWRWWMRLLISGMAGLFMGIMTWSAFTWLFLWIEPEWYAMRLAGVALAFAFVSAAMLNLKTWRAILFTAPIAWLPAFALFHKNYLPDTFVITPAPLVGLLIGVLVGWLASRRAGIQITFELTKSSYMNIFASAALGFGVVVLFWVGIYVPIMEGFATGTYLAWDAILVLTVLTTAFGIFVSYLMKAPARLAFLLTVIAGFAAFFVTAGDATFFQVEVSRGLQLKNLAPPSSFGETVPLIYITNAEVNWHMVFTVMLPMFFIIMLGAYGRDLLRDWWYFIGPSFKNGERGGWLTGILAYGLPATAIVSILSVFNMHTDIAWAIGWSVWGFLTFIFVMATWRRALWGARGLMVMMMLLIAGGFLYDLRDAFASAQVGVFPALFGNATILLHPGSGESGSVLNNLILQTPILFGVGLLALLIAGRTALQRPRLGVPALIVVTIALVGGLFVQSSIEVMLPVLLFWVIWAGVAGTLAVMAYRRIAWAGIALPFLTGAWLLVALFTPVQESMAVLAMMHTAILVYAIQPAWSIMEAERFQLPAMLSRNIREVIPHFDNAEDTAMGIPVVDMDDEDFIDDEDAQHILEDLNDKTEVLLDKNADIVATAPIPEQVAPDTLSDAETGIQFEGEQLTFPSDESLAVTEVKPGIGDDAAPSLSETKPRIRINTSTDKTKAPRIRISTDASKTKAPRIRLSTDDRAAGHMTQPAPLKINLNTEKVTQPESSDDKPTPPETASTRPRIRIQTASLEQPDNDTGDDDIHNMSTQVKINPDDLLKSSDGESTTPRIKLDMPEETKPRIRLNMSTEPNTDAPKTGTSRMKLDMDSVTGSETSATRPRIKLNLDTTPAASDGEDKNADKKPTARIKFNLDDLDGSETIRKTPRFTLNLDEPEADIVDDDTETDNSSSNEE